MPASHGGLHEFVKRSRDSTLSELKTLIKALHAKSSLSTVHKPGDLKKKEET